MAPIDLNGHSPDIIFKFVYSSVFFYRFLK